MSYKQNIIKNVLIVCIAVYYGKGVFYSSDNVLSTVSFGLFFLISLFYLVGLIRHRNIPLFIRVWALFFISNVVLFIVSGSLSDENHYSYFVNILGCMLPMFPFYILSKNGVFVEDDFRRLFLILLPISVMSFFGIMITDLTQIGLSTFQVLDTNNLSYSLVGLIPLVFFIKNKRIGLIGLILILLLILVSLKRGAILSGVIFFFFYLLSFLWVNNRKFNIISKISTFLLVLCSLMFLYSVYIQNEILISRIDAMINDKDSSGRDVIWSVILSEWSAGSNVLSWLFGYGFGGGIILTGSHFAHNDWLELLSSLGIYGVLLYAFLFIIGISIWIRLRRDNIFWWIWGAILISWLLISVVSMYYPTYYFGIMSICMAYMLAKEQHRKNALK